MGKQITEESLAKLRTSVAHCSPQDDLPADYVKSFAEPLPESACLNCGAAGMFTWGLVHGEGRCATCGWPARLYHFIKDADGKETRVVRLLQYHPDGITLRASDA